MDKMKRILASGLMVFFVLGALLSPVWAKKSEDAAIHKQIQSLLDSVAAMFDKKDLEGLVRTVVPGATLRYANGKEQTIEEWKSQVSKEFAGIATMKSKFKVERVVSAGDTCVATYREVHNYVLTAEKGHKYRNVSRWSVTMVKTPQGWKATHFVEFFEKVTRDGKPVKAPKTPRQL